jgi:hypothetical protein
MPALIRSMAAAANPNLTSAISHVVMPLPCCFVRTDA